MRCRVVTWNIHSCVGSDGRYDPGRIGDVLEDIDADIIALQEVDWREAQHEDLDQFDYLAKRLGMHAVEGANLHDHRGKYGNGLLTRFPVEHAKDVKLAFGNREPRGAIDAVLGTDDGPVRVLVTHLGLKLRERRAQVRTLRHAVESGPSVTATLLLGDMNEWISARLMRRAFTPTPFAWMETARSFPSYRPLFPLDCLFANPLPHESRVRTIRTAVARAASDHLPIVADLAWRESGMDET
jgi:endonuclease/exonuclease/phosphatase family metal-dependent hydrolase